MSSTRRRFPGRHPVVVDNGCGCQRLKLTSPFSFSFSKPTNCKASNPPYYTTTTSSSTGATSPPSSRFPIATRTRRKKRISGESVAVVKESSEPYTDFKESMLQMIVEMEMYGWDELNGLLYRLLSLNSPDHHHLILRAFSDIWDGVLSDY